MLLPAVERAVLGGVASTPAQRAAIQRSAEEALLASSYAYWEHTLLHWAWAVVLELAAAAGGAAARLLGLLGWLLCAPCQLAAALRRLLLAATGARSREVQAREAAL